MTGGTSFVLCRGLNGLAWTTPFDRAGSVSVIDYAA